MKNADLNLLLHLDALIRCSSVSIAAEQLGITQPAMSAALSRLRRLFNDPLLIREKGVTQLTARAIELHRMFQPLLEQWLHETSPRIEFDSATSVRHFTLYATDYIQSVILPKIVAKIAVDAPSVQITVLPAKLHHGLSMLGSNHVEYVIGYYPEPAEDLRARFLFQEKAVCIVRSGHPCLDAEWNIDAYLRYSHIDIAAHTRHFGQLLDQMLQDHQHRRRIGITLSSYLATPHVVAHSDLIATVPDSIAALLGPQLGLTVLEVPLPLPTIHISLYWHERYQHDAAHAWFRQYICRCFELG